MIDKLKQILLKAGASETEIQRGIYLSKSGYEKLQQYFQVDYLEIRRMLAHLQGDDGHRTKESQFIEITALENHVRYGYEADILGNVSINDTTTGDSHFVGGTEGHALLRRLEMVRPGSQDEQELLSSFFIITENKRISEDQVDELPEGQFKKEIENETGTYNFPWSASGRKGTATASYSGEGDRFAVGLLSIRDENGNEVKLDHLKDEIRKQAIAFIGDE